MRMILDRLQRFDPVAGEYKRHLAIANLPAEFLQDQSLEIGLVIDDEDGCGHAACSSRESISWRSSAKSIGLVNSPTAPRSIALRRGSPSPQAGFFITRTSGRPARPPPAIVLPPPLPTS